MRNHPVINFLLFTGFLVIGYTLSIRFYQPGVAAASDSSGKVTTEHQDTIATLENGQRSLLLISVDEINSSQPRLASIWLASYLPGKASIQFLPIFPSGAQAISGFESQLELSFRLNKVDGGLKLDDRFLRLLDQHNYWWSGYFVFDQVSLAKVLELFGGTELYGKASSDLEAVPGTSEALADPGKAYSAQMAILQSICHPVSSSHPDPDLKQWISLIPSHILTNLDASQLQLELEKLTSKAQNPTCRFPTLEISRVEP